MDNETGRDHLQDPWWASMFSTSSLWVDIMSTPLNSCHLAPGFVIAFRVRLLQLYYSPTLPSGVRALGLGVSPRISVSVQADDVVCNEKGVTGSDFTWGQNRALSLIVSAQFNQSPCSFALCAKSILLLISHLNKGAIPIIFVIINIIYAFSQVTPCRNVFWRAFIVPANVQSCAAKLP